MRINVENDEMLGRTIENKLYLELFNRLKEKDKEIERLNKIIERNKYTADELNEIDRLNNIIETFEEELERESNMKEEDTCLEHNTFIDIKNTLKSVLKRFQELKGSNSNEQ